MATADDFQPTERGAAVSALVAAAKPALFIASVAWASVDPTPGAPCRADQIVDALERLTQQRECGCWIGATHCHTCNPAECPPPEQ